MSLTPAHDEQKFREKREAVELCGKNRGPHDYIPIEWSESSIVNGEIVQGLVMKRVSRFICRVCFVNVSIRNLLEHYPEVKR